MKRSVLVPGLILLVCGLSITTYCNKKCSGSAGNTISVAFQGPPVRPSVVYACWLENINGVIIQNLYICNSVVGKGKSLLGDALPYWKVGKKGASVDYDSVTGASVQQNLTFVRNLNTGDTSVFRVCFEIDRSRNHNKYFKDRPSFIYKSALINLKKLKKSYQLSLTGWMANDTGSPSWYSQQPLSGIKGFKQYRFMDDLSYIAPHDDMVSSINVRVKVEVKNRTK